MTLPRRQFLRLAAGAVALPAVSRIARAQTWPSRPVRIIVGYAPGGLTDIIARVMGQWLSERFGQQVIVENRPGAGSNIGTEVVARATPDGYTLLLVAPANAINTTLYEKLNYDFLRDIVPIASIARFGNVMEVNPTVPVKSVPEFIAYAKANPGKINFASSGAGSTIHMSAELFKMMAGVNLVHVPYRGAAPAITDLLAGQVQVMFDNIATSIQHIREGKLRPLAVTTAEPSELLPGLPPVANYLPGYEASGWYGVGAPKGTAAEIINKLHNEISAALADPKIKARFADLGVTVLTGSSADFGRLLVDETEKWGKVIKFSGAKPD
jgi:tripartite-type tricarboxylate transporter receptor subunit TctC